MTIRERIKQECERKQISLNKLEIECGLAKGYVSKLDKSTPNATKLQLISDYLGVSLDYLMNGNEDGYYLNEETKKIAQAIFENKQLKLLFDTAKDIDAEDIMLVHAMLKAIKKKDSEEK